MAKKTKLIASHTLAQVSHGVDWLAQMTEPVFRDEILNDLFSQMKKHGAISDFIYLHGRNEHGIDWLILDKGALTDRYVGIQAKSRGITKQGDARTDSALAIKQQCESAYDHRFNWNGNDIRVDNVELWMSSHITSDAVEEFIAPVSRHKISVKRSDAVFALLEKHCKHLLSKIPGLAETGYLHRMSNPESLPIRILGVQLNPKKHFLEPRFSNHSEYSLGRVFDKRKQKMSAHEALYIENIVNGSADVLIVGPELSGKTYILKRLAVLFADRGTLPVSVEGGAIASGEFKSVYHLLANHLSWYSLAALKDDSSLSRPVVVLIDNFDALDETQMRSLRADAHKRIRFIAFGRRMRTIDGFTPFFISGVKSGAVHSFIRSLDIEAKIACALTDRASQFIQRTIGTSGLPANPFTVSVMLQECHVAKRKLATPTMGRLIERFVEGQIGSHSEHMRADFETKLAFMTALGGSGTATMSYMAFHRRVAKYLANHGHAHDINDFEQDILDSGLLDRDAAADAVRWTHPVFLEFFWARNLIREKRYDVLGRHLLKNGTSRVAAIVGSQMGNAHPVMNVLLDDLSQKTWMKGAPSKRQSLSSGEMTNLFPEDSEEEEILRHIEANANGANSAAPPPIQGTPSASANNQWVTPEEVSRSLEAYAARAVDEKHFLANNIGALLVNSRGLNRSDKERAVLCVLRSTIRMGQHFGEVLNSLSKKRLSPLMADTLATYWCLVIADSLIGDAFLAEVFRGRIRNTDRLLEQLILTDMLVACGSEPPSRYVDLLRSNPRVSDAVAVYIRLLTTYYFRFHKPEEKAMLKEAMKEVRRLAKGFSLPPVA